MDIISSQTLSPKIVDLNSLIHGMTGLLSRTLGETISIRAVASAELKMVEIDPGQVETALLNLAVNARHAMPDGGQLTIETANVELDREYVEKYPDMKPGSCAMLAVSDTGTGMSSAVLDRVFEPFYTTKEVGQGSGLGLSMVYGFVKQSGGHVSMYSAEGKGTTAKLYFPVSKAGEMPLIEIPEQEVIPEGSGETVLIVEDDDGLRKLAVQTISGLGYNPVAAKDGPSSLAMLDEGMPVDVLFTDIVLPQGLDGVSLATAALERRPGLRVLYTSGYAENAAMHNSVAGDGIKLLNKPYRRGELARRLRQALEG